MSPAIEIFWLGHACFKIKTSNGKIIYIDPYNIKDDEEKADIIISTHGHFDHFSAGDIKKLVANKTIVIGPASISRELKKFNGKPLELGESFSVDDITIELVPAYTIKKGTHPKGNNWAGVIITHQGKSVYHAGDTERIPEMKDLAKRSITVALLPCGGTYTMDFEEATDAAVDIKPEIAVPMHNWDKDLTQFKTLLAKKDPSIRVEILEVKSLQI
ncbi:MAG: MBL fold metallo-hydrolase [Promethearchaeota archaeon]